MASGMHSSAMAAQTAPGLMIFSQPTEENFQPNERKEFARTGRLVLKQSGNTGLLTDTLTPHQEDSVRLVDIDLHYPTILAEADGSNSQIVFRNDTTRKTLRMANEAKTVLRASLLQAEQDKFAAALEIAFTPNCSNTFEALKDKHSLPKFDPANPDAERFANGAKIFLDIITGGSKRLDAMRSETTADDKLAVLEAKDGSGRPAEDVTGTDFSKYMDGFKKDIVPFVSRKFTADAVVTWMLKMLPLELASQQYTLVNKLIEESKADDWQHAKTECLLLLDATQQQRSKHVVAAVLFQKKVDKLAMFQSTLDKIQANAATGDGGKQSRNNSQQQQNGSNTKGDWKRTIGFQTNSKLLPDGERCAEGTCQYFHKAVCVLSKKATHATKSLWNDKPELAKAEISRKKETSSGVTTYTPLLEPKKFVKSSNGSANLMIDDDDDDGDGVNLSKMGQFMDNLVLDGVPSFGGMGVIQMSDANDTDDVASVTQTGPNHMDDSDDDDDDDDLPPLEENRKDVILVNDSGATTFVLSNADSVVTTTPSLGHETGYYSFNPNGPSVNTPDRPSQQQEDRKDVISSISADVSGSRTNKVVNASVVES